MRQLVHSKPSHLKEPIWCDFCRLRIAPYEKAAISGAKAFHSRCFPKSQTADLESRDQLVLRRK